MRPRRPLLDHPLARRLHAAIGQRPLLSCTLLYASLAAVAVWTSGGQAYVADNRFEQYWTPGRRLARLASLWDGTRDLGRVPEEFWPGVTVPLAVLRGLGLAPHVVERAWHVALITLGAVGVVAVLRASRPGAGVASLVAGTLYGFGAYSASFLVPSNLYAHHAIAPWLLYAFLLGVTGGHPWRWAAAFALLVFAAGNVDWPGLLFVLLPVVAAAVSLVGIDRSVTARRLATWTASAALLSVLASAAALAKATASAGALAQRLYDTELPVTVNVSSSWAESWRGLGFWLLYFRDAGALARPQGAVLFESPPVVIATFVPPVLAIVVLWRSRWRGRLLFAGMMLLALVVMVGSYPPASPPPYGALLLWLFDEVPSTWALRSSYKAGAGLLLGVAVLAGVGVQSGLAWVARERPRLRGAAVAGVALVVLLGAAPFWSGSLYDDRATVDEVPAHWYEALAWVDAQPGDGRTLVLPGTTRTTYRWGAPGDDIFDALLRRPHAVASSLPLSNPLTADLLEALDRSAAAPAPGSFAPIARRLGIDLVVIRNDLDWRESGVVRPAALEALRRDPELVRLATFGSPGHDTFDRRDDSEGVGVERRLPPVEVYALRDPGSLVRVVPAEAPSLLSGSGAAWPDLAARGHLEGDRPVRYSAMLDDEELAAAFAEGAGLTVTDTARRRVTIVQDFTALSSHTLSDGEDLDRPARTLFDRPEAQTTTWYADATSVRSLDRFPSLRLDAVHQPARALDEDVATAWWASGLEGVVGEGLRVELRTPHEVDELTLRPAEPPAGGARTTAATVAFSDGTSVAVDLGRGPRTVRFPPRTTEWLEVRIAGVGGGGAAGAGFAEISVRGLDLRPQVQVPHDVFARTLEEPRLRGPAGDAPVRYAFGRSLEEGETVLRRRFATIGAADLEVEGTVAFHPLATDDDIGAVLDGPISGRASSRGDDLAGWGGAAVDGSRSTGWVAAPRGDESLDVRFPSRSLRSVEVSLTADARHAASVEARVRVGGLDVALDLDPEPACTGRPGCRRTGRAAFPPVEVDRVELVLGAAGRSALRPVRVEELLLDGEPNPSPPPALAGPCTGSLLTVDGDPVPLRLAGSRRALLAGGQVEAESCEPVAATGGWHLVESAPGVLVDEVSLADGRLPAPPRRSGEAIVVPPGGAGQTSLRFSADVERGSTLVLSQSYDVGWRAEVDGRALGPPIAVDGLNGWVVPASGPVEVVLSFAPQRRYDVALLVTLVTVASCAVLVVRRPARP